MTMKPCVIFSLLLFLTFFIPVSTVLGAYQLEYRIEVNADGSAIWIIEQKGRNIQIAFDAFVEKVKLVVDAAEEKTGRNMTADDFGMSADFSDSYIAVKYQFCWNGFAEIEDSWIKIGDVFEVEDLFLYFYGDGTVCIVYPSQYAVENVSPRPHERSDSIQMLEWYGIGDFGIGEPRVVLKEKTASVGFTDIISENAILIITLATLAGWGSIGLYYFKFRKKKEAIITVPHVPPVTLGIEDDEEKVVTLLKSAGGRLYQSTIANQCGFSRAKTSKLLASMEEKGRIRRQKKGREKVVTLIDEVKEFRDAGN